MDNSITLVRRSPLYSIHAEVGVTFQERAGWQIPSIYSSIEEELAALHDRVGIVDISTAGILRVRGEHTKEVLRELLGDAPISVGDVLSTQYDDNTYTVACLVDDEFLLVTRPSTHTEMQSVAAMIHRQSGEERFVTVVDESSGLAGILVAGPTSRTLLSKLCALSFYPQDFPDQHVAQSSVAEVHMIVVRNDMGTVPTFELYADRSYAMYAWESMIDAGKEIGIVPVGWHSKEVFAKRMHDQR